MKFENLIYPTENELFTMLCRMYKGKSIGVPNSYILVEGEAPILLVAHLDTVHEKPVTEICKTKDGNIWMSPQGIGGDDRCGVYALVTAYQKSKVKPWMLFTCGEEVGGIGADAFAADYAKSLHDERLDSIKCIVEVDRKGSNDAVYYDCGNEEFENYITSKGFETETGSFSDISYIAPEMGVAAVNLSSGYYNAHQKHEYINIAELKRTISKVISIVEDSTKDTMPRYEYVDKYMEWRTEYDDYNRDYAYLDNKKEFKSLEVEEKYDKLLDVYTPEYLDSIIDQHGEAGILMLYECEMSLGYMEEEA